MGGESSSSDSFKYKFGYNQRGRTVAEFFFNDFCSTPSCSRKIRPLPTFELLTPSPTAISAYSITSTLNTGAIVTEEISAKDISVTDILIVDAGATGSIPEALEGDQSNKKQIDDVVPSEKSSEHTPSPQDFGITGDFGESLPMVTPLNVQRPHDDGSYSSIDRSAHILDVAIPEYIQKNTLEKVKEYIDLVEEEIEVDDSHLESLISDIEKSIENYSTTNEDIKKEFREEVGKNVMEDVGSIKMERVSLHKQEKEIAEHNNDDSFACETEVSKKGKAESSETIDSYNDIPYILVQNYINWLIDERKKKEKIESIIAEKEIDLEKAKDNPCYDTMKAQWLKDKQKMTYRDSIFFADKCRQSMSEWEKMFPNNNIFHADFVSLRLLSLIALSLCYDFDSVQY
ncbi:Leucine--tRNA ligase [Bienertia sinuspersici]